MENVDNHEAREPVQTRDVVVARPFTLTTQSGEKLSYGVGTHKSVPLEVADHWYVKAHEAREGEDLPTASATAPASDRERSARVAAEDEAVRLRVISQKAVDDKAAAELEVVTLKTRVEELEGEIAGLRSQLADRSFEGADGDSDADEGDATAEGSTEGVVVSRKGNRWFVHKDGEQVGRFNSKAEADAKATELLAV